MKLREKRPIQNAGFFSSLLDKLGVLAEVVKVLTDDREGEFKVEVVLLCERVQRLCQKLNVRIERSRQRASHRSVAHNVKRVIREFLQSREHGCSIIDAENLLVRIDGEVRIIEENSEKLRAVISHLRSLLDALSQAGQTRLASEEWSAWKSRFEFIKRDPLDPALPDDGILRLPGNSGDGNGQGERGALKKEMDTDAVFARNS